MKHALLLVAALAACKQGGDADCSRVAAPVLAEIAERQKTLPPDQIEAAKKYTPIYVDAIVKSCKANKWNAGVVAICSKHPAAIRTEGSECDGALTPAQLKALREDASGTKLGMPMLTQDDIDKAVREVKAKTDGSAGSSASAGSGSAAP